MVVMVLGALGQVLDLRLVEGLFALVFFHLAENGVFLKRLLTVLIKRVTWRSDGKAQETHVDILLFLGVHSHLGRILGGLMALAGIDVVGIGLDGSLTLVHGGLVRVNREIGRVGERHVTNSWCAAKMATL